MCVCVFVLARVCVCVRMCVCCVLACLFARLAFFLYQPFVMSLQYQHVVTVRVCVFVCVDVPAELAPQQLGGHQAPAGSERRHEGPRPALRDAAVPHQTHLCHLR